MTAKEQIEAFLRLGCEDAILEIKQNGQLPLSDERLAHHVEEAITAGLVARVMGLAKIRGEPLTDSQIERLTKRCLQLEWVIDALFAARHGKISDSTRGHLIGELLARKLVYSRTEAMELLQEKPE